LRGRWAGLPRWARWVLAIYVAGFADGTGAHVRDLVHGGIRAYAAFPQVWLQVFFVSLVFLDPLAVVLAGLVRRESVWLAAAVMVMDITANWIGDWPWLRADPARLLRPAGPLLVTVFGAFVLISAGPVLRVMASRLPLSAGGIRPGQLT
jgi:hypothetical protein